MVLVLVYLLKIHIKTEMLRYPDFSVVPRFHSSEWFAAKQRPLGVDAHSLTRIILAIQTNKTSS
jgi:hypothetical protein